MNIEIKQLSVFTIVFIIFTVIGTISHEFGHILVAQYLGYETELHHASASYHSGLQDELTRIYFENQTAIDNGEDFAGRNEYEQLLRSHYSNRLWISIGGPAQTILTGTLGLIFLFFRRRSMSEYGVKIIDWLAVFFALFWLRQVFNLLNSVGSELLSPNGSYFGGDELHISEMMHLWEGTVPIAMAIPGFLVSVLVIFKFVPYPQRLTFIASGILGGSLGFWLWMEILGPQLLP